MATPIGTEGEERARYATLQTTIRLTEGLLQMLHTTYDAVAQSCLGPAGLLSEEQSVVSVHCNGARDQLNEIFQKLSLARDVYARRQMPAAPK